MTLSIDHSTPLSHKGDPSTSLEAERKLKESGGLSKQCEEVLEAIKQYPNCTAGELEKKSGIPYMTIQRRVSQLEEANYIKRYGKRVCWEMKTKQTVWGLYREPTKVVGHG